MTAHDFAICRPCAVIDRAYSRQSTGVSTRYVIALFQETRNLKLDHYLKMQLLRGSTRIVCIDTFRAV